MARDWDAERYEAVSDPQARWGREVLQRLPLLGNEWVLDAGCGTGRVTEELAARLPNGRVVALDLSEAMAAGARRRLDHGAAHVVVADLLRTVPVSRAIDAVLSTATFHWVPDHDALFRNLAAAMRPGARMEAQCGGAGNLAGLIEAAAEVLGRMPAGGTRNLATPEQTRAHLEAAVRIAGRSRGLPFHRAARPGPERDPRRRARLVHSLGRGAAAR
jgi:trans-aconitate 2-methyltransferase